MLHSLLKLAVNSARRAGSDSVLTSFAWCPVLAVLGAVPLHHLPLSVIPLDRKRHAQDVIARLDDAQNAANTVSFLLGALPGLQVFHQLVLNNSGTAVKEPFDHLEEIRVVGLLGRVGIAADSHQRGRHRESGVNAPRGQGTSRRAAQQLSEIAIHD